MTQEIIGEGYTVADIISDRLPSKYGHNKFIGYIDNKDEYIIATKFVPYGYGWSEYYMSLDSLLDALINEYDDQAQAMEVVRYVESRDRIDYRVRVNEVKQGIFDLRAWDCEGEVIFSHCDGYKDKSDAMECLLDHVGQIDLDERERFEAIKHDGGNC